jgi:hypothetical protein
MKTEKERRVYYQDIVYSICAILDRLDGKKPGLGISCGTADESSTDVLERISEVLAPRSMLFSPQDLLNEGQANYCLGRKHGKAEERESQPCEIEALEREFAEIKKQRVVAEKEMDRRTSGYLNHVHDLGIERDELKRQIELLCNAIRCMTNLCRCPRVIRWKDGIDVEEVMHTKECIAARMALEEAERSMKGNRK